jgi:4-amino-4-deoxy-L-arabinose transferase-like glycosyltransferase
MPRSLVVALLALVLALGALLRFAGVDWDAGQHLHPDERFLTMVVAAERWPAGVREYFDESRSPLNPRNVGFSYFAYGTLPTTLLRGTSTLLGISDHDRLALLGRTLSALADLGSVLLLFLVANRLYHDARIALLASFLLASSTLPIQHAHFFVVDPFAVVLVMASMWALVHAPEWRTRSFAVSGMFLGFAIACKLSAVTFACVIAAVAWPLETCHSDNRDQWRRGLAVWSWHVAVAGIAGLIAFRVTQPDAFAGSWPFAFVPSRRWLADLVETQRLMSGDIDFPPGIQWADRTPFWFPWKNLVFWGTGPALGLTAWVAWSIAAWRIAARRDRRHLIPVLWVAVGFLQVAIQFVMTGRYLLPIYPSLALLAAWLLVAVRDRPRFSTAALGAGALIAASTLVWAIAFTAIYRHPNTRVLASRWIYQNVAAGSSLATEHWDDRLPLPLGSLTPDRYKSVELANFDDDTPAKLASLIAKLDVTDYVILSSNRLSASIPRLPMRYPMTTKFYHLLLSENLGFRRIAQFTSYPRLGPLQLPDQGAEEAFSVYDHAPVQIFRKTAAWNPELARAQLDLADWDDVVHVLPRNAREFKNGLMLLRADWVSVRKKATWPSPSIANGLATRRPVLSWLLALEGIGLIAFPLGALVLEQLPDRGWLLSKSIGLLLIGYLGWVVASLQWTSFETEALQAP